MNIEQAKEQTETALENSRVAERQLSRQIKQLEEEGALLRGSNSPEQNDLLATQRQVRKQQEQLKRLSAQLAKAQAMELKLKESLREVQNLFIQL